MSYKHLTLFIQFSLAAVLCIDAVAVLGIVSMSKTTSDGVDRLMEVLGSSPLQALTIEIILCAPLIYAMLWRMVVTKESNVSA